MLPLVTVVPYVLLATLAVVTVAVKRSTGGSLAIDLVLCGAAAAWVFWMFTLHPAWRSQPAVMALFLAGFIAIMAVLVIRDPWFGYLAVAGYAYAFRLLPWPWVLCGVAAVAIVAGTAQASGVPKTTVFGALTYVAVLAANVLPMCGLAWVDWNGDKQHDQRDRALSEISEANRRLEATLAENASLHEQLLIQARQAGVLDERQRMAQEIHDTIAQGLTGIITQLQAAEQAGDDPVRWRRHFDAATRLARDSLSEARRSVNALRPPQLESARLSEAIAGVAERWSALNGIAVQVTTTGAVRPMPAEAEVALLRTAQEALANVAKHAHATRVGVTLSYMEHEVAIDVRDDGRGFDLVSLDGGASRDAPGERPSGGFGLIAMRQRIEGLSGTLQVESEPRLGTAISACVPAEPFGAVA